MAAVAARDLERAAAFAQVHGIPVARRGVRHVLGHSRRSATGPGRKSSGSHSGSHRWEIPSDTGRRTQTVRPAQCLAGRCQATYRDASRVPSKQRVAGSNPAGRTAGRALPGAPGPRMFGVLRFWSGDVGVAHRRHIRCGAPALISADGPVRRRGFVRAALNLSSTICPFGHWCWPQGAFCGRVGRWALCVPPC